MCATVQEMAFICEPSAFFVRTAASSLGEAFEAAFELVDGEHGELLRIVHAVPSTRTGVVPASSLAR